MFFNTHESTLDVAIKATPIGVTSGLSFMNVTVPDLIQYLTLAYTILLLVEKGYVYYKRYKAKRESKK